MWKASLLRSPKNARPQEPVKPKENKKQVAKNYDVVVTGQNVPKAIQKFESCIGKLLMRNVNKFHFKIPTPIQNYAIPIILSGKDLLVSMPSNCGKKIAYLLPIIQKLLMKQRTLIKDEYHCEPHVIIVTPVPETAKLIKKIVDRLTNSTDISSLLFFGLTYMIRYNKVLIAKGCHILVATPDRLYHLVHLGLVTFSSVKFLVLDGIDIMFSDKFKSSDTYKIMTHSSMPSTIQRQTIMLSATLSSTAQNLVKDYLNTNYIYLANKIITCTPKDIKHYVFNVKKYEKLKLTTAILKLESKRTIVFVKTKWSADFLAAYLCELSIPSTSIHGDRPQNLKKEALNDFNEGKMNVIVTTSTALKNLDIECVNQIIIFDMPKKIALYERCINSTYVDFKKCATFFDMDCDQDLTDTMIETLIMSNRPIPSWLLFFQQAIQQNKDYNFIEISDAQLLMTNMYTGSYFDKEDELVKISPNLPK